MRLVAIKGSSSGDLNSFTLIANTHQSLPIIYKRDEIEHATDYYVLKFHS